jgi:hypothetical protein
MVLDAVRMHRAAAGGATMTDLTDRTVGPIVSPNGLAPLRVVAVRARTQ